MLRSPLVLQILLWILLAVAPSSAFAQGSDTIRVMAYNLLAYPDPSSSPSAAADTALRNPFYRTVIHAALPDIVVVCEMNSQTGYNGFLQHVMNANGAQYSAATYVNSNDTERGLYYRSSSFQFISNTAIKTALRDINQFVLRHIDSGDTLRIFAVHLKASSGSTNEQTRLAEVDSLRKVTNQLHAGSNFIVCGDFNLYGAFEPAYQRLLQVQAGNSGHVHDALSLSGTWNNSTYAVHHTQSPRVRSFGGGATGGMDDRFDLILYSTALQQSGGMKAIPSSLRAFGNDGLHYNDSINRLPNNAVSAAVANAIHNASDHLPVIMDFEVQLPFVATADVSPQSVVPPANQCAQQAAAFRLLVRNTGTASLNFSAVALNANLRVTSPGGSVSLLSRAITSGTLAAGSDTLINLLGTANLTQVGSYLLKAWTSLGSGPDANPGNDTLNAAPLVIAAPPLASISPSGTISACQGDVITLTASGGVSFLWSTGSTTSTLTSSLTGNYTVTVTDANGCSGVSAPVTLNFVQLPNTDTLYFENMGLVGSTTSISTHQNGDGFSNDQLFFSGTGDVRSTSASAGYVGASAGANIFLTNIAGRQFQIDSIDTYHYTRLELTFSAFKNTTGTTGSDLSVQYSTDGVTWVSMSFPALGTGATWYQRTSPTELPAASRLLLRFTNTGSASQYRIDDVILKGVKRPRVRPMTGTTLCNGNAVTLESSTGENYTWNTGASTSSVEVTSSGTYTVTIGCISSQPLVLQPCAGTALQLSVLVEGMYAGNQSLVPRLLYAGKTLRTDLCDSVSVDLIQPAAPYQTLCTVLGILKTNGTLIAEVPAAYTGQTCFLRLRGLGWVQTWSKQPVLIQSTGNSVGFSTP
ncbi:MAG: endonuclease/exonuclease/phosphatase family protein [Bacteroidota bacterium]